MKSLKFVDHLRCLRERSLPEHQKVEDCPHSPNVYLLTILGMINEILSYLYYSLLLISGDVKAAAPVLVCMSYFVDVSSSLNRLETLKSINLTSNLPLGFSVIITLLGLMSLWQIEISSEWRNATIHKS